MKITLPKYFSLSIRLENNNVYQLGFDSYIVNGCIDAYSFSRTSGYVISTDDHTQILVTPKKTWSAIDNFDYVLLCKDSENISSGNLVDRNCEWLKHPRITEASSCDEVVESYQNAFTFKKEDLVKDVPGLRSPQLGGIYAALAHWQIGNELATIVMPTGTGKTETMLSLLVVAQCSKMLIVVPSDALRSQLANKFITLGLLKTLKIVNESALYPRVGILRHCPTSVEAIDEFLDNCNVVITTMSIASRLSLGLKQTMANKCSHLFIDEAHHVAAKTWKDFKSFFTDKYVLQFTATPYRNDDKNIGGEIIFNYPLRKAQEEGYFKSITNHAIYEYNPEEYDRSIARKAIDILNQDLGNKYNHILMARVNSIDRANEVFAIYNEFEGIDPIVIHTGLGALTQKEARHKILNLETRVIICVDMFGEGFDMPELKIAAFHDIKKSLLITLQLAGRFTRTNRDNNLGDASIVMNLANIEVADELRDLYARDADWNQVLPIISDENTREQISLYEFMQGFSKFPNEIQLQNVTPALSTVVYKTNTDTWFPYNFQKGIVGIDNFDQIYWDVNSEERTLVIVTGNKSSVRWGDLKDIYEIDWVLYVVYWNQEQQLLYINCSENGSLYEKLASAVTFDTSSPINAEVVYRSLGNINRLRINNVGLKEPSMQRCFSMYTGEDVEPALSSTHLANRIKSNIFGVGFEDGYKVSVGCSYKGRVWTRKTGNIEEFVKWCNHIGSKLLDDNINSDDILSEALYPEVIDSRPNLMPISIEWNETLFNSNERNIFIECNENDHPIYTVDLELYNTSESGDICFKIYNDVFCSTYKMEITNKGFEIINIDNPIFIRVSSNKRFSVEDYFHSKPPIIRFFNGAWLEGNKFINFEFKGSSYNRDKIAVWNWSDVNIREESQKEQKIAGTIQRKVISSLLSQDYDIIFDDDGSGEAADIVTVKINDDLKEVSVEFYHLKFSSADIAGSRIGDLYEVCGQAQKSILWKGKGGFELFKHMIHRESLRLSKSQNSRFEKGTLDELNLIKDKSERYYKTEFKIVIVQPGLSKANASGQQLELLAVTENHLLQTYCIELEVIGNA